jgi:hypothetical protein
MTTHITGIRVFAGVLFAALFLCVGSASALSASWSQVIGARLYLDAAFNVKNSHVELFNPNVTIQYRAFVKNAETGEVIPPGGTVFVGTPLELVFDQHTFEDAYWFATGGHMDTPYGEWRADAAPPAISCEEKDFVFDKQQRKGNSGRTIFGPIYVPFVVNPPIKEVTGFTHLGCDAPTDGSRECVAESPGEVPLTFTFESTFGKFYPRVKPTKSSTLAVGVCHGNNAPMFIHETLKSKDTINALTIPPQTINYPITVVAAPDNNNPPSAPNIVEGSGQCIVGSAHSISMTALDPEGDNIRYAIDWNNDGSADQFVPSQGFVSSGTTQSASRTFATAGSKTVRVRAEDDNGLASAWSSITFTCSNAPSQTGGDGDGGNGGDGDGNGDDGGSEGDGGDDGGGFGNGNGSGFIDLSIRAIPSLVTRGSTTHVHWSASNVTSCTVTGTNGDAWSGLRSPVGGERSSAITERVIYTLTCVTANGGTASKQAVVNILPVFNET